MSNSIINHETIDETKIANQITQNSKFITAPIEENVSTEIKLTNSAKPFVHSNGVGINPLVDAAAYIFAQMGKLVEMRAYQNLEQVHIELRQEIQEFKSSLIGINYMPQYVSECVPIATYVLCATLDGIIANTSWGGEGKWNEYRLLNAYHQEILSRENVLILLERFIQDQETFIDMIEFIYICLNLGSSVNSHLSGFSVEQLQRIMLSLYKRIRTHRGNFSKVLSPYSLKISQASYTQPGWLAIPVHRFKKQFDNQRVTSSLSNTHPVISQEIQNLKSNFNKMIEYLNNKSIKIKDTKIQLTSLPWVLITGASGSGKSTLIENSQIKFVIDKNKIQDDFKENLQHSNWNWWITPKAVLIDVPSSHALMKRDQNLFANAYWENLLDLIIEQRGPTAVNNATLVISLSEILNKSNHQVLIAQLIKKIIDLQKIFGEELAVNLIITKCDGMTGFSDFFDDYTNEELFQPWGISLPQVIQIENMNNGFYKPFDSLIQRINKQVIYRLHQERYFASQNKFHIKNFPLQVERLKENLGDVIQKVVQATNHFVLKGFYLTSAKQFPLDNDQSRFAKNIYNHELFKSLTIMDMPVIHDRPYFIKHVLLNGLVAEENTVI